jgi:hypothetical protein
MDLTFSNRKSNILKLFFLLSSSTLWRAKLAAGSTRVGGSGGLREEEELELR